MKKIRTAIGQRTSVMSLAEGVPWNTSNKGCWKQLRSRTTSVDGHLLRGKKCESRKGE